MVAGICGGLGEYLDIDPTIVRVVFIALVLANGMGVLAYLAMWLIVPEEGETAAPATAETAKAGAEQMAQKAQEVSGGVKQAIDGRSMEPALIAGIVLIVLGVFFMLQNLNVWWLGWVTGKVLWPAVLIAIGLVLLLRRGKGA
jgi:phage shock protein C